MTATTDALVIGGGPAGAAVASRLAAAGRAVILCERHPQPRPQVCGEFISASAIEELHDLGVAPTQLGAAEIRRVRVIVQDRKAEAGLPFPAYGLSRTRLDGRLLDLAARSGVEVWRGAGVRSLTRTDGGAWEALLSDRRRIVSRTVLLASGKHELRGHRRAVSVAPAWVGFKTHWRLLPQQEAALGPGIELFLHRNGYAGLQPIEAGVANLCLVMSATMFQTSGASFAATLDHLRWLIPTLDERLRDATPLWSNPASVAGLPYGYVCRASACADNLYRVGDQVAVIPSFTGEGIAIALRTASLAAEAIMAGVPSREFVATVRQHVCGPMRVAAVLEIVNRRQVLARPFLRLARSTGLLPTLARATRLQDRATSVAVNRW